MKLYKLLTISIGLFMAILLGEVIMRFYYRSLTSDRALVLSEGILAYRHKPSIKFINKYGIQVKYNSLGLIGEEVGPKNKDIFRIFGVGDSITAATYLPENERYLNRLAGLLSKETSKQIEIINAGVGGYNTRQELELMQTIGISVEPDMIIVGVCLNDFVYVPPRLKKSWFGGIYENYRDGSKARYLDFIYQRSDLYKFLYDSLFNIKRGIYTNEGYKRYLKEYNMNINPKEFAGWKKSFLDMISFSKMHNIKILFVIFPPENNLIKGEDDSSSQLVKFFKESNTYYLDLIKFFKSNVSDTESLFQKRDMLHPTSLGHKIAAEAISSYIIEYNLLK